jgi:hypothetical protein
MRFLNSGASLKSGESAAASAEGTVFGADGEGASPCASAGELLAISSG